MRQSRILSAILTSGLLVSCCFAAEPLGAGASVPRYSVAGSVWRSQGSLGFELGDDDIGTWSRVEWPLDGMVGGIEGQIAWPLDKGRAFIASARYGRSLSMDGISKDWDWRPWQRPDVSDYSETDSSGSLQTLDIRAGLRFPATPAIDLQLVAGFSRTSLDFEDNNLIGSYDYGQTPISYQGPVDTYSADFSGFCLGGEIIGRAGDKLTLGAGIEAIVNLSVNADAEWIRQGNSFEQDANGAGLAVSGKAGYEIRQNVTLTAEARWISQSTEAGRQSGTQDGAPYNADIVREMSLEYLTAGIGIRVDF